MKRRLLTLIVAAVLATGTLGSKCATVERGAVDVKVEPEIEVDTDVTLAAQVTKLEARIGRMENNLAIQIGGGVDSATAMILAAGLVGCLFLSLTNLPYAIAQRWKPTRRLYDLCKGKPIGEP